MTYPTTNVAALAGRHVLDKSPHFVLCDESALAVFARLEVARRDSLVEGRTPEPTIPRNSSTVSVGRSDKGMSGFVADLCFIG
jgi:hypothetical protein